MTNATSNSIANIQPLHKLDSNDNVEIGSWYILDKTKPELFYCDANWAESNEVKNEDNGVLVCADSFESNLVIFKSNDSDYRVLNVNLGQVLTCITEADAQALIQKKAKEQQTLITKAQTEIKEIVAYINMSASPSSESTELMVASENALLEQSRALKNVHGKRIEELNKSIKGYVEDLHEITKYYSLPAMVGISKLSKAKDVVDEKLRELNLYGGLNEKSIVVSEGGVASESQPVHIYQNLKHMDVECILGYQTGGIDVSSVSAFNEWLAEPINRNRVLPADKSIVAIAVRKYPNARVWDFTSKPNDTYLYIRNGENIKAVKTDIEIEGTLLATENDFSQGVYAKKVGKWADTKKNFAFLSKNEYEHLSQLSEQAKPLYLNVLLDSYRAFLDYLVAVAAYGKHKLSKIGVCSDEARIITKNGVVTGCPRGQAGYEDEIAMHNEKIEEVKQNIDTIVDCINNGFANPNLQLPKIVGIRFGLLNVEPKEIGFIDDDGVKHFIQISAGDYHSLLKSFESRYNSLGLYFPNKDKAQYSNRTNNPYDVSEDLKKYTLINDNHYFFDDIKSLNWERYKRQNELAILIQGLFDRSAFFGHTQVSLFQDGFDEKIKLVHDLDSGLYNGDMPDFELYLSNNRLNSKKGDVFFGQQALWNKELDDKNKNKRFYDRIDMPRYLKADSIVKKRDGRTMVKFKWQTEHPYWSKAKTPARNNNFECNIDDLINVSHYQLNDCKEFAEDPRCRDLYPKWGNLMMAAESYHQKANKK